MTSAIFLLFVLGSAIGSFIGVIADRYEENLFLLDRKIIGGRSRCEFCRKQLRWFEIFPIFSFLFQAGRCRSCGKRIGWKYLFYEIISGCIFAAVPFAIAHIFPYVTEYRNYALSALWIAAFSVLFLISLIDSRLRIIPDEANLLLLLIGVAISFAQPFDVFNGSFIGHYALLFGLRSNPWLNRLFAAAVAGLFFAALIFVTKGKGMGGGDMKLAAAMGFIFGWPDISVMILLSFIMGSVFGFAAIVSGKERLKSKVPFGPFLALSAVTVFFFGFTIVDWYFGLFR